MMNFVFKKMNFVFEMMNFVKEVEAVAAGSAL